MNNRQIKYENPIRLAELKPMETLKRIGVKADHVICDIGAGSGVFTIPAAELTKNKVFALDINDEMLSIINEKAKNQGLTHIELIQVKGDQFDLPDQIADCVILCTVLHEISDKTVFLKEIRRILKNNGILVIIEFHKQQTPMGPPISNRLGKDELRGILKITEFAISEEFDLGDNLYCATYSR